MDVDFVHKEGQKGKSKGKGKQNEKGKSTVKGQSDQEKFQGTRKNCGKTEHKWSECWAKGGGAAKQANNAGETEKTGDVNWIMMVQDLSVGQSSTSEIETWRCSGTSVSCKSAHESQVSSMQSQIALFPIPMLQNQVRHSSAQLTTHISLTSDPNLRIL